MQLKSIIRLYPFITSKFHFLLSLVLFFFPSISSCLCFENKNPTKLLRTSFHPQDGGISNPFIIPIPTSSTSILGNRTWKITQEFSSSTIIFTNTNTDLSGCYSQLQPPFPLHTHTHAHTHTHIHTGATIQPNNSNNNPSTKSLAQAHTLQHQ